jgi:hypothetical protein
VFRDEYTGEVNLQLGTSKSVTFDPTCSLEDVVLGVTDLIERVVGVSTLELVQVVGQELGMIERDG